MDYARVYGEVRRSCNDSPIVVSAQSPFVASFYGVNVDYVFAPAESASDHGVFYEQPQGTWVTRTGGTPVLRSWHELSSVLDGVDFCYVTRYPNLNRLINRNLADSLRGSGATFSGINFDVTVGARTPKGRSMDR